MARIARAHGDIPKRDRVERCQPVADEAARAAAVRAGADGFQTADAMPRLSAQTLLPCSKNAKHRVQGQFWLTVRLTMLSPSRVESSDGSVPLPRAPSCERALEIPMSTLIAIPVRSMFVLWKEMSARQDTAARGQTLSVRTQAAHPLGVSLLSRPPIPMWLLSLICAVRRRSAFGFELTSQPEPRVGLTAIPANLTVFESKSTFWMPLNVP